MFTRLLLLLALTGLGSGPLVPAGPAAAATVTTATSGTTAAERRSVRALVAAEARAMHFPVSLALAVARAESDFDPRVESHMGARGVMQIMPRTAAEEYGIPADLLWQPRLNVRLGIHFLKRLLRRYRGRTDLALSYYNGGSAVGDLPRARVLPATRDYVRKVRRYQRHYRRELLNESTRVWTRTRPRPSYWRPAKAAN
ncbi:MAG: lytic transglycosylase domain-containing protein [Alphaproteobacteria bacterium]|jgi:soluble lytic murein transglycosylase-like protein|nr:lytic transglycosylase domain-containing protein [Alphaproteobacteria bacterium]MDP6622128.1 lytic transglycosylase domain-containing protein [Alphaproteobacteria bacterium]|tara:strand:+ start:197 stop:793 length:597 start_codon:yes stop_codon:yes gene_type:complete